MSDEIRMDDRVAIVTGAGAGLGRAHALLLASRGAKVVVNDLGGSMDGTGSDNTPAQKVCDEIKAAGGEATPDYNDVVNGEAIVQTAVDAYGKVDIVVNNAGILRDISFLKQTEQDWDLVLKVHLQGSKNVTKAAFPIMRENKWGRIVMTTSAAGLFGNFGQTNYSAAKLGIVGLANTLKLEGAKYNVLTNTIAPLAGSRLTETVLPPNLVEALKPEYVSPLVALLCSEKCPGTGGIYAVGGGFYAKVAILHGAGTFIDFENGISPEDVLGAWDAIANMEGAKEYKNAAEAGMPAFSKIMAKK
jgi:(3R)-3-hydroxyacyl-CoA dehydrogenase / 3a,7a,12a-trihydroxy-5b-cholest-24-enoyl-CoA hydratase / enoyl-CoA hydratase 2